MEELLRLTIIFLGGNPPSGIRFNKPGANHHARWMAKAIYSLKMFMFTDQFLLTEEQVNGLREVCMFVVVIHVKIWFAAPLAAAAPNNDLQLLKELWDFQTINPEVSKVALHKMQLHLWYLSESLIPLAFFTVTIECKRAMVAAMKVQEGN